MIEIFPDQTHFFKDIRDPYYLRDGQKKIIDQDMANTGLAM